MCNIISKTSGSTSEVAVNIFSKAIFPVTGTLISLIYYLKTIKLVRKTDQPALLSKNLNTEKLLWYPMSTFIIFLPNLIYYILGVCFHFSGSLLFEGGTMLITHSLGTVNAVIYGLQRKVHKDIKRVSSVDLDFQRDRQETINWENVRGRFSTMEL